MSKLIDLTGQRFGRLVVVEMAERKKGKTYWRCRCDCGEIKDVRGACLRKGRAKSCGCSLYGNTHSLKHGYFGSRLYNIWCGIVQRCTNPKQANYKLYGGRGIKVCEEWRKDFKAFHDWAVANGYTDDLTIDRIDVNGNYCPENCRWATKKEQSNNTRTNRLITYKDETHTLQEWADFLGASKGAIYRRLKRGWSVEKALTTPIKNQKHGTPCDT